MKKALLTCALLFALGSAAAGAVEISYVAGQPQQDGNIEFTVTLNSGVKKTVTVAVKAADTPEQKAFRIQVAMQLQGVDAQLKGNVVMLRNVKSLNEIKDQTGEVDEISAPLGAMEALIDFHGTPSGVDRDTLEAVYRAAFGFNGLVVDANLTYGDLTGATLDALLTDIFNEFKKDLAGSALLPNLSLNLTADTITFLFPAQQTDYFVRNFSSDTTAEASMGLTVVAEPDALTLLVLGLAALGVMVTTRRKGVARDFRPAKR